MKSEEKKQAERGERKRRRQDFLALLFQALAAAVGVLGGASAVASLNAVVSISGPALSLQLVAVSLTAVGGVVGLTYRSRNESRIKGLKKVREVEKDLLNSVQSDMDRFFGGENR